MKRNHAWIYFAAILLASLTMISCKPPSIGEIVLINEGKESIKTARIEICEQTFEFKDIKPRQSVKATYKITQASDYDIYISFKSGKEIRKHTGYVMCDFDSKDTVVVKGGDIIHRDAAKKESQKPRYGFGPR